MKTHAQEFLMKRLAEPWFKLIPIIQQADHYFSLHQAVLLDQIAVCA